MWGNIRETERVNGLELEGTTLVTASVSIQIYMEV